MKKRISIVGLGEVGGPLASIARERFDVLPIDLDRQCSPEPVDVIHICFPYQVPPDFLTVSREYIRVLQPRLTIVHSTVAPGTTAALHTDDAPVAYSPVRGKHVRMGEDLLHYTKFVAAPSENALFMAEEHLSSMGLPVRRYPDPTSLELAKLLETTYFGLHIAWAQELNRFAEATESALDDVWEFFDEVPYLSHHRFVPGYIGGHCVMPNIEILGEVRRSVLLDAIAESNRLRATELGALEAGDGGTT